MTSRITGGSIGKKPFEPDYHGPRADDTGSVGTQVEDALFGRSRPQVIEPDEETAPLLARLDSYRKKLARLVGDAESDYRLVLAAGTIAAIDASGTVFVGRRFLLDTARDLAIQVGVLAHEVGHRPQRWVGYRDRQPVSRSGLVDLCRLEETRADYFAGYALAHLRFDCAPLCGYLHDIRVPPHPEYFSAALRAKTIREGFDAGGRRQANLRKFFPELARATEVATDLGDA